MSGLAHCHRREVVDIQTTFRTVADLVIPSHLFPISSAWRCYAHLLDQSFRRRRSGMVSILHGELLVVQNGAQAEICGQSEGMIGSFTEIYRTSGVVFLVSPR